MIKNDVIHKVFKILFIVCVVILMFGFVVYFYQEWLLVWLLFYYLNYFIN